MDDLLSLCVVLNLKDMRNRLASLIVVKQEPISDDFLTGENDENNRGSIGLQTGSYVPYHHHHHYQHHHSNNQPLGSLNHTEDFNNNESSAISVKSDVFEEKKCMYGTLCLEM